VGGAFLGIGGEARRYLAAVNATTGTSTAWDPRADNGGPFALLVDGTSVYVGGYFYSIGGLPQEGLAAMGDVSTPALVSLLSADADGPTPRAPDSPSPSPSRTPPPRGSSCSMSRDAGSSCATWAHSVRGTTS